MQDQNLHQTLSRAKEVNPWPWPSEPNAPGYVFCEDRLTTGQRAALRLVYRESYDANAADILAGAHLRAWPEQVLIVLLLQLTFHKLDYLLNDWVASIGTDDFNAELSVSLKSCRDFIADSATDNRQAFFDQAHLTWPRLLSLYRKGSVPNSAGTYEAISATSLSQLPGDQLARDSHLGQLALTLCLVNYGRTQGLWTLLPAQSEEIAGGSFSVNGTWDGAEPRPVFIIKSVSEAILLEEDGAFQGEGAIVVHADNLWPQLRRGGGSVRSPRSSPGRNASVTKPQIAYRRAGDLSGMQARDCALTYPQSCAREGALLEWTAECSWENPLSIEAKSPRSTAHTQHLKSRNKSHLSATPKTSAPIAERFSARAVSDIRHQGRIATDAAPCTFRHEGRGADIRCSGKLNWTI
jgi:hypothetical protein